MKGGGQAQAHLHGRYSALGLPDHIIEAHRGKTINTGHVLGRIVSRYLADLGSHAIYLPDADRHALEQPTIDLLRALFTTTAGDETQAREPLHATLGARMIDYLKMHLKDPDLNIARVAGVPAATLPCRSSALPLQLDDPDWVGLPGG